MSNYNHSFINPSPAKLFYLNFQPLEVVSRYGRIKKRIYSAPAVKGLKHFLLTHFLLTPKVLIATITVFIVFMCPSNKENLTGNKL